jgi:peptidyl-prolyl cis-trans isomerase SurA
MDKTIRILILLAATAAGLSATLLHAQPREIDKVVAIVDDDIVLQSEFEGRWKQVQDQIANAQGPVPPEAELRKQVLDSLILEHLQLQMAERAGVRVDDNQLNAAIENIAQSNNMTFEQFRQVLDSQNLYQITREALRKEIIIGQFQNGAVNRRIDISRQEVENYLRSEAGASQIAPEYHVAHILIPYNDNIGVQLQQELADGLYQRLTEGTDIRQIIAARAVSGIPISGGDLPWSKVEGLPSLFADVVPQLQPGEISKPFTSNSGFHIVQLLERRGGSDLKLDQVHVRHILIKPNEIRTEAQAETLIRELYARIQNGEDFANIARQNTDDPQSMVSGGDLDWINRGNLPDDFMDVVYATPVGMMSEPFRASTGWHIIEVLDRRLQDVTEENKRFQAERLLRERKFENELQNWLTEIRDTSYIDIKED